MMMFKEYKELKMNGNPINIEKVDDSDLKNMIFREGIPLQEISVLFDTDIEKIENKKREFTEIDNEVNFKLEQFVNDVENNKQFKKSILAKEELDRFSKAVTHFAFLSDPVLAIYKRNNIPESEINEIRKLAQNRTAYILKLFLDKQWALLGLIKFVEASGASSNNDTVEIDDGNYQEMLRNAMEKSIKQQCSTNA